MGLGIDLRPKMNFKPDLYVRIAVVLALTISVGSVVFVFTLNELNNRLEQTLLNTLVGHELEEILLSYENGEPTQLPHSAVLQVYLLSQTQRREIPSFLIDLSPRIHENVEYQNRIYHVAVADIGDDRLFIAFDISEIKKHERDFTFVLAIAGIIAPLLVLVIAVRYINRVVKPVSAIAQEVSALNPDQRNVRMTGNYKGNEVKQIAGAINQYIERLDGFVEREQMFTAAASHELRTPIAVIQTSVELAEKFNSEASLTVEYLQRIDRAAGKMEDIIEGLLFLARETHEAFDHDFAPISVYSVVKVTLDESSYLSERDNIELAFDLANDLYVKANATHLSIVIGNLIHNALDRSPTGTIKISFIDNVFSVHNVGASIASEDLAHVFERGFHGVGSGNHGLGLYISKKICDHYNWNIKLSSSPIIGTCAEICF